MAQGSRQVQSQVQQQVQTLSPQQILVVKLLELPAVELEDRVRAELLENPALEEGKEETAVDDLSENADNDQSDNEYDSLGDYLTEDDIPDYKLQENNRSKDEQAEDIPFSDSTSFYEILKERKFAKARTIKRPNGLESTVWTQTNEFNIELLPQLTADELAQLAKVQAAAAGM